MKIFKHIFISVIIISLIIVGYLYIGAILIPYLRETIYYQSLTYIPEVELYIKSEWKKLDNESVFSKLKIDDMKKTDINDTLRTGEIVDTNIRIPNDTITLFFQKGSGENIKPCSDIVRTSSHPIFCFKKNYTDSIFFLRPIEVLSEKQFRYNYLPLSDYRYYSSKRYYDETIQFRNECKYMIYYSKEYSYLFSDGSLYGKFIKAKYMSITRWQRFINRLLKHKNDEM